MNRKYIFGIPIFEDQIDLDRFNIPEEDPSELEPTWDAGVPSTFSTQLMLPDEAWNELELVIQRNLGPAGLLGHDAKVGHVWRNRYQKHHYQDIHLHPHSQWSFIVYESVTSKTSFINPNMGLIQNQISSGLGDFPLDYKPELPPGHIIIFPSFIMHQVNAGNEGTTVSGNIYMKYHQHPDDQFIE